MATPTLYLRAVQASTTNPEVCIPTIVSSTTSVNMGYTCKNPLTCQAASNVATSNATPIVAGSPNANPPQFSTPVSITFDANGSAPITARYDDVDQVTLNASTTVTPFGGAAHFTLQNPPGTGVLSNATVAALAFGSQCPTPPGFEMGCVLISVPTYALPSTTTAPTDIYLRAQDSVNTTVTSRSATPANSVEGGLKVVSGRINIPNSYGSERPQMPLPATVLYYDGTNWRTSPTHSLSSLTAAGSVIQADVGYLTHCPFTSTGAMSIVASSIVAGVGTMTLPGPVVACSANITANGPAYLPSAAARATFGIYKSLLIYRREKH